MLNVKHALSIASDILRSNDIEAPVREAGVLLAFVMKKDISCVYAHLEDELTNELKDAYMEVVAKRSGRVPFQHISNNQEFMSLDFYVDENCLIPRPDTEILVETALQIIKSYNSERKGPIRILDIGTGSGAIAVSLTYYDKNVVVDAIDISKKALEIAKMNAQKHLVHDRIRLINADFFSFKPTKPYHMVVSNPPYIPNEEINHLMPEVRVYEPTLALDGGEDGLCFYRGIASSIRHLLVQGGTVLTEVGIGQDAQVKEIFENQGLSVSIYKDYAGINRVLCGK
ncbi:MAG TPA: peptide chain release factor N(5)-glutamine methyltransferase [Thermoclostridium sp.]|nr:peptide chain release factor N(5)-glutamine methyltransferase [Thermoclostridium sp.]